MAHKYGAKRTTIDNITFDSRAEASYYQRLKMLKAGGIIQDFEVQPVFMLQEGFKKNGKTHQPITYSADFKVVHPNGFTEIIDVKGGKATMTEVYRIKKKLFEKRYPELTITEVLS